MNTTAFRGAVKLELSITKDDLVFLMCSHLKDVYTEGNTDLDNYKISKSDFIKRIKYTIYFDGVYNSQKWHTCNIDLNTLIYKVSNNLISKMFPKVL